MIEKPLSLPALSRQARFTRVPEAAVATRLLGAAGTVALATVTVMLAVAMLPSASVTDASSVCVPPDSGRVSQELTDEMKAKWGALAYLRGAIEVLKDLQGYEMRVTCDDGRPEAYTVWNFIVANGRTVGGVAVAPEADIMDGLLDLIVIQPTTTLDLAQLLVGVVSQRYLEHESVVQGCRQPIPSRRFGDQQNLALDACAPREACCD